jgi:hypothetical protein
MTLYEVLAIIGPVLTVTIGGLVGHVLNGIKDSIKSLDKRVDALDQRLSHLEKETYFIKGLLEGKNMPR